MTFRVTMRYLRISMGHFGVNLGMATVCHLWVTTGHLRSTVEVLEFSSDLLIASWRPEGFCLSLKLKIEIENKKEKLRSLVSNKGCILLLKTIIYCLKPVC